MVDRYKSLAPRICCVTYVRLLTECVNGKFKHTVKYTYLSSAMSPVPHSAELPPELPENLTFSNDNSDYDDDQRQQEKKCLLRSDI